MGKQVKTPRFYVDMPTFLHATGQLGWDDTRGGAELLYMNCSNPYLREVDSNSPITIGSNANNNPKTSFPVNFCALLNHNFASNTNDFKISGKAGLSAGEREFKLNDSNIFEKNILNANSSGNLCNPQYNGTSIWTFNNVNGLDDYWRSFAVFFPSGIDTYTHQLGSLVVGKYFDCPNSPDLNLTMSRRFDGIKSQKTIGGKTLSNIYYDGPTEWTMNGPNGTYKYPPFELDLATIASTTDDTATDDINEITNDFNQISKSGLGRKGLRSWKLTFSYIAESDMWMENEVSNTLISDGETDTTLNDPNPMLSDNSFNFVWNCTLGGTLPFIFQPDKDNSNPDQFAICTFRENTFSVDQVAPGTYSVEVTIDELA